MMAERETAYGVCLRRIVVEKNDDTSSGFDGSGILST
jgi:hypothetical protein